MDERAKPKRRDAEELVRYMSNLPNYLQQLQRGYTTDHQVLNFGVLDWSLLENWKIKQSPSSQKMNGDASSSSRTNPFVPKVEPQMLNGRNRTNSLAKRKTFTVSSSHTHLDHSSVRSNCSQSDFQQHSASTASKTHMTKKDPQSSSACIDLKLADVELQVWKGNISSSQVSADSQSGRTSVTKGLDNYDFLSSAEEFEVPSLNFFEGSLAREKHQVIDPCLSKAGVSGSNLRIDAGPDRSSFSGTVTPEEPFIFSCERIKPPSCRFLSSQHDIDQLRCALGGDCPTLCEENIHKENISVASRTSYATEKGCAEAAKSLQCHAHLGENEKRAAERDPKSDSSLVNCKDRSSRSHSFREVNRWNQSPSGSSSRSSSARLDEPARSSFTKSSERGSHLRNHMSPLRRMLSPLLRSKASKPHDSSKSTMKHNCSTVDPVSSESKKKVSKTSKQQPTNAGIHPHQPPKGKALNAHAVLRTVSNNGVQLFVFCVDGKGPVLAAMKRKTGIGAENPLSWRYTFHSVDGSRRKSGWLKQGNKENKRLQISNVIGQMEVNSSISDECTDESNNRFLLNEFVVSELTIKQSFAEVEADEKKHAVKPHLEINVGNEVVAIITKTLHAHVGGANDEEHVDGRHFNSIEEQLRTGCNFGDDNMKDTEKEIGRIKLILPGGVHGFPAAGSGQPSRLIDRWRSGGVCDCGGWDLACSLTILEEQTVLSKNGFASPGTDSSSPEDMQKIDLFAQAAHHDEPSMSFTDIHEGLSSVDFGSSVSPLQAFAFGMAILHNRSLAKMATARTFFESLLIAQEDRCKIPAANKSNGVAHVTYMPIPPVSPVGRA